LLRHRTTVIPRDCLCHAGRISPGAHGRWILPGLNFGSFHPRISGGDTAWQVQEESLGRTD